MAKIVIAPEPPEVEINEAIGRIKQLITRQRGRDGIALTRLASAKVHLEHALTDLAAAGRQQQLAETVVQANETNGRLQ